MSTSHLLALARTVTPTHDGDAPADPTGPHAILYGGTPRPTSLDMSHHHATTTLDWQVVCVHSHPNGARLIADGVTRAIDGQQADGHPHDRYTVTYTSPPIKDSDDPTAWRWSTTVEVQLTIGR